MSEERRHGTVVAVVLAGGGSRRFGSDKLAADVGGRRLLDRALDGLPPGLAVVVVGPPRPVIRAVRFVQEDPPGSGPAAGLVVGVRAALSEGAAAVVTMPGDAPDAGRATGMLLDALAGWGVAAVVATDAAGFDQPLQLALTRGGAEALLAAAGPTGAAGESARALVLRLQSPVPRVTLPATWLVDIDTSDEADDWLRGTGGLA